MKNYVHIFLFTTLILSAFVTHSQNAEQDLKKVNDYVNKQAELWLEIEYKVFPNWEASVPSEVSTSVLKKKGEESYMVMKPLEVLQTAAYSVSVNTQSKSMQIANKVPSKAKDPVKPEVDYKAMLDACKSVNYKVINENLASYILNAEYGYKKTIITFNRKSFKPISAEVHYLGSMGDKGEMDLKKNPKVLMTYKKIAAKPSFDTDEFSYERFFTVQGQNYIPNQHYKGYTINGNLIK